MSRCALFLLCALAALPRQSRAHVRIAAPSDHAKVLTASPFVEIRGCNPWFGGPGFETSLDGRSVSLEWEHAPYVGRWQARIPPLAPGDHTIEISGHCPLFRTSETHAFTVATSGTLDSAERLATHFMRAHPANQLAWNWGESVFLYGLERVYDTIGKFPRYVHEFQARWGASGTPQPDRSDLCPEALTALALGRDHGDWAGLNAAIAVRDYVRFEPRNRLGALNHLGHSWFSAFFPDSIWVDSLMMAAVYAAQWGAFTGESDLLEFGAAQPLIYASVLQDPDTGLFRHAWKVNSGKPIPESDTFWLRGNGWVLVSIAEILDALPSDSPRAQELIEVFRKTADGLLRYQLPTGLWDSVANLPGFTYPETSGTSLISYALAKAVHRGWIPSFYMAPAKAAFAGVTAILEQQDDGLSMPGISGATDPGARWTYGLILAEHDAPYGVGAYLLAATELRNEEF